MKSPGAKQAVEVRLEQAASILELLRAEYGRHAASLETHPTDSLIGTILSQHTASLNSRAAYARLKERYQSWHDVAAADAGELAETIRVAGLGNIKAARIQAALRNLQARFGTMDLAFLREMDMDEARAVLVSLPGVGMKTASCVLLFSCGKPALAVDTHVHRLARRLGLVDDRASADSVQTELESIVPAEDVYDMHVNLIAHGRQVCLARAPRCELCVLQAHCRVFRAWAA